MQDGRIPRKAAASRDSSSPAQEHGGTRGQGDRRTGGQDDRGREQEDREQKDRVKGSRGTRGQGNGWIGEQEGMRT